METAALVLAWSILLAGWVFHAQQRSAVPSSDPGWSAAILAMSNAEILDERSWRDAVGASVSYCLITGWS